jgi:hypothetical protein
LTLIVASCALALAATPGIALASHHDGTARGHHGGGHGQPLLHSGLVGSTKPSEGGATIFDVVPGGLNWVVDKGSVRVSRDGRLDLRVKGLVIPEPPLNGTNPIESITATVYCNGTEADTTELFPLSVPEGDARIRAQLDLPDVCVAPVVLVHPRGIAEVYIAASG